MAIVKIAAPYSSTAGPGSERSVPVIDMSIWNVGIALSKNAIELVSNLDPSQAIRELVVLYGNDLNLEGSDYTTNVAGNGLPLVERDASGIITRILIQLQVSGGLQAQVDILDLNISLVDLLAHASNITEFLMAGNDHITATDLSYDLIHGYDGDDTIIAGEGADSIFGDAGNDILLPGRASGNSIDGPDLVDGGSGIDTVSFDGLTTAVQVNLATGLATGVAEPFSFIRVNATLFSIESIIGGSAGDILIGHEGANRIAGGSGNDQLHGRGGNDALIGDGGNDAVHGNDGNDRLYGGAGNDGLFGDAGNDILYGGSGNDFLSGGNGNDIINGDVGHDRIFADAGNDTVTLGVGDDGFTLGLGDDKVMASLNCGRDSIFDFGNGADVIDLSATGMTLQTLQNSAVETSAGVLITLGTGSLLLAGLEMNDLQWNTDFVFAA